MKTAEIFFANGSSIKADYADMHTAGEWIHFVNSYKVPLLSVSSRQVLYIEHDVDA